MELPVRRHCNRGADAGAGNGVGIGVEVADARVEDVGDVAREEVVVGAPHAGRPGCAAAAAGRRRGEVLGLDDHERGVEAAHDLVGGELELLPGIGARGGRDEREARGQHGRTAPVHARGKNRPQVSRARPVGQRWPPGGTRP